jgi:NAD-dependent deacetylase
MPLSPQDELTIDRVVELLDPRKRLLFVTGAGISADSGVPTYRGVGGLYEDRATPAGLPIESVLSGTMLEIRPELTWEYLLEIAHASRGATFNRGHRVIAEMEDDFAHVWILTQNVDGFHRLAGSRNVTDIHGDLHDLICTQSSCDWNGQFREFQQVSMPPRCPKCDHVIRPDVVLFGEELSWEKLRTFRHQMEQGFDLVFSVGTTGLFPYIVEPVRLAHRAGIPTVEINPGETEMQPWISHKITARAAEALAAIWSRYRAKVAVT